MDSITIIGMTSIICAAFATSIGCMMPALAEGKAVATALTSLRSSQMPRRPLREPYLLAWQ